MATCAEQEFVTRAPRPSLLASIVRTRPIVPSVLIAASFLPILALHGRMLWARPHYHMFPLVIPAAIFLAIRQRPRLDQLQPGSGFFSTFLAAVCWLALGFSVAFVSPLAGMASAIFTLGSAMYALGGFRLVRILLPALIILLPALPLPSAIDARGIAALQTIVSRWASASLDLMGFYHAMEGNVVELEHRKLLVDQACSGINSLFTLSFGALVFALWERLSTARTVALLVASLFWVLVGNMARIVAIVFLSARMGIDASTGWSHWFLGLLMFGLMLGLVASTNRMLKFIGAVFSHALTALIPGSLFRPKRKSVTEGEMVSSLAEANAVSSKATIKHRLKRRHSASRALAALPAPALASQASSSQADPAASDSFLAGPLSGMTLRESFRDSWLSSWPIALAFCGLFAVQFAMPNVSWKEVLGSDDQIVRNFESVDLNTLPDRLSEFRRTGFGTHHREDNNSWGEHSRTWSYAFGHRPASVSADYQFVGWHDLTTCYKGTGWIEIEHHSEASLANTNGGATVVAAEFTNLEGRYGYLLFGLFDRTGKPLAVPGSEAIGSRLVNQLGRWTRRRDGFGGSDVTPTYQFQAFIESETNLNDLEKSQVRKFFDAALVAFQNRTKPPGGGTP